MLSPVQQGRYDSVLPPEARKFYDEHQKEIRSKLQPVLAKLSVSNEAEHRSIAKKEIALLVPGIDAFPELIENVAANFVFYSKHHIAAR